METLTALYDLADRCDISIDYFKMDAAAAFSIMEECDAYYIAIDPAKIQSEADEKVKLAHELGHCLTGSFYCEFTPLDISEKHENYADRWAFRILLPRTAIKRAFKAGCREYWELADYLDIPEEFVRKALEYYKICG